MKHRAEQHQDTTLVEVLGWTPRDRSDEIEPRRRGRQAVRFVAVAAVAGLFFSGMSLPVVGSLGIGTREAVAAWEDLPNELPTQPLPQRSVILAADGSQIAEFYSENRVLTDLAGVAQVAKDAILAIEDSRFYDHTGVDAKGTLRAVRSNASGESLQGGSTLTQQYVKNVLLTSAKTPADKAAATETSVLRKIREARYALRVEATMTKDQILEGYLNIAYFGDGAYGIGTAASHYFNKPAADLTLPEAALLAGLVKNPTGYDPTRFPEKAQERRDLVLTRMADLGYVTPQQAAEAKATPVTLNLFTPSNGCHTSKYPFYCQWVRDTLATNPAFGETEEARQEVLFRGGMTIKTNLDPRAQDLAQAAVDNALGRDNRVAAAAVTVQPGTGKVVAMATNRDFGQGERQTEIILPTRPAFQPGSTFKAFTLAAALEQGYPVTGVIDAPDRYSPPRMNAPKGGFRNAASYDAGPLTVAQGTARSSNTFYVKLEEKVGVLDVADMAGRLGITSLPRDGERAITERDASLTLGAYEVSPLEMAGAYAAFAAHGVHCVPHAIDSITGPDGQPMQIPDPNCHQVIAPGVADTITGVLQGVIDGPDPYRTGKALSLGRPAAGKTGTTNDSAAVWFTGYTPAYTTAVWAGDPRGGHKYPLDRVRLYGRYTGASAGATIAGPIWKDLMAGLHAPLPAEGFRPVDPNTVNGITNITPDVRGLERDKAIQVLQDAGFTVRVARETAPADPMLTEGRVATQAPEPGSQIDYAGVVALTLTHGSKTDVTILKPGEEQLAAVQAP